MYSTITKIFLLLFCAFLTFVVMAKPASIIGTWKLNEASNSHIKKLNSEQQFLASMIASVMSEVKFYDNGKFHFIEDKNQGTWKKEKMGFSWLRIDADGKKFPAKLMFTKAGKLKITFDKEMVFFFDRYLPSAKDKQNTAKIAQIKKIIPYERMFRTPKKNFMGYFNYMLINRDGTTYTMINKSGRHISAKDFKASASIKELLVEKSTRADYTVTANGIYSSIVNNEQIKILSPRQLQFRGEIYDIQ